MSSFLRRLSPPRIALLCLALPALGGGAAAAASAVETGPVPKAAPLPVAIRNALAAAPVEGLSARVQYTDHLFEGASLAGGGDGEGGSLGSGPLLTGATGRIWIAKDGRVRLELQTQGGSTEVLYDGHTLTIYDSSSNTLYRFARPTGQGGVAGAAAAGSAQAGGRSGAARGERNVPSVAQIEAALGKLERHVNVSAAAPTDIAGRPAYTVTLTPREAGSLLDGVALSWDAAHGVPLRAAVYSTHSSTPVVELVATEISYGPVAGSLFTLATPEGAKVLEPLREGRASREAPAGGTGGGAGGAAGAGGAGGQRGAVGGGTGAHPQLTRIGSGITTVLALHAPVTGHGAAGGASSPSPLPGARRIEVDGAQAQALETALGTVVSFERSGTRYLMGGLVPPSTIQAAARGL